MSDRTRRSILASLGTGVAVTAAGCATLPPGPTDEITLDRTARLGVPDPGRPNPDRSTGHVLAIRAQLENLVTQALPRYEALERDALDDDTYRDLAFGVESPLQELRETADDPATDDAYGFYQSAIPRAGFAFGFLRHWSGEGDVATVKAELERVRESVVETARTFEYACADPARLLANVGWAERQLYLADVADVGEVDVSADADRRRRAERVGRVHEHVAKMRRDVTDARYLYRAALENRPAKRFAFAAELGRNRETLSDRAATLAVDPDAVDAEAERTDDRPLAALLYRLGRAATTARQRQWRVAHHLERERHALAALAAGRAVLQYESYRYARDRIDPDRVRGGPPAAALFEEKRRAVRAITDGLAADDPLLAWLLDEASRLARSGDSKLEHDWLESDAAERAVAYAHYLRATGYARAAGDVVDVLERREDIKRPPSDGAYPKVDTLRLRSPPES